MIKKPKNKKKDTLHECIVVIFLFILFLDV